MDTKPGVIIIEGHVQGLSNVRALGEHGIPVWVIDKSNCVARYSKYCQNFAICPEYESTSFIFKANNYKLAELWIIQIIMSKIY